MSQHIEFDRMYAISRILQSLTGEPGKQRTSATAAGFLSAATLPKGTVFRENIVKSMTNYGYSEAEAWKVVRQATGYGEGERRSIAEHRKALKLAISHLVVDRDLYPVELNDGMDDHPLKGRDIDEIVDWAFAVDVSWIVFESKDGKPLTLTVTPANDPGEVVADINADVGLPGVSEGLMRFMAERYPL